MKSRRIVWEGTLDRLVVRLVLVKDDLIADVRSTDAMGSACWHAQPGFRESAMEAALRQILKARPA